MSKSAREQAGEIVGIRFKECTSSADRAEFNLLNLCDAITAALKAKDEEITGLRGNLELANNAVRHGLGALDAKDHEIKRITTIADNEKRDRLATYKLLKKSQAELATLRQTAELAIGLAERSNGEAKRYLAELAQARQLLEGLL